MSAGTSGATVTSSSPPSVLMCSVSAGSEPLSVNAVRRPLTSTEPPDRVTSTYSGRSVPLSTTGSADRSGAPPVAPRSSSAVLSGVSSMVTVSAPESVRSARSSTPSNSMLIAATSRGSLPREPPRAEFLDPVDLHVDRGHGAGELDARAVAAHGDLLADVRAVEVQRVRAAVALDVVAAVARAPREVVVAPAEQRAVGAAVAGDVVVARAAEQRVVAVAAEQRVVARAAVLGDVRERRYAVLAGNRVVAVAADDVEALSGHDADPRAAVVAEGASGHAV